jgi:hypothetical protein
VEVKRLRSNAMMGCYAAQIPRRLGEASSNDLAADKFMSKAIGHTYWQLWKRMVTARNAPLRAEELADDEMYLYPPHDWQLLRVRAMDVDSVRQLAATVRWTDWWEELRPRLRARERAIATFALKNGNMGWGYRIVSSIENELDWIENKFVAWYDRYFDGAIL